jgi:soluble cytochrome b562
MSQEEINGLTLSELMDILVDNTMKLLKEMHKKNADGITIRDMRLKLQGIQKAIENKKSNKLQIA